MFPFLWLEKSLLIEGSGLLALGFRGKVSMESSFWGANYYGFKGS